MPGPLLHDRYHPREKATRNSPSRRQWLWYVLMLGCLGSRNAAAQVLSDTLKEQQVKAGRTPVLSNDDKVNRYAPGQKIIGIDSVTRQLYEQQNVAQLLSRQTPVFIKSYGFNALSTLNFRGASSAQSQVYWNGVPLQNAALGVADVSMLPVSFYDRISVVYGSSAALWGSGNVGGALLLENDAPVFSAVPQYKLTTALGAGSFGQYNALLRTGYSGKKLSLSLRGMYQSAQNDFPYTDADGRQQHMKHSRLSGAGLLGTGGWRISEKQTVSLSLWWQQYDRQVPPALFEALSLKHQEDASFRVLLDWSLRKPAGGWYAKAAFLRDQMDYKDPAVTLASQNTTQQYFQELGYKYGRGRHHLQVFVPLHFSWMDNQAGERKEQRKAALAAAYSYATATGRLKLALNLRDEQIDSRNELMPGVNAGWQLLPWLRLRGNVQRTFRAPTLNELYYVPGGNPDLKPETGWTQELGYGTQVRAGSWTLQHDLSFFNRSIRDWIIWYGGAIWTPHNIATVHSRGIETENHLSFRRRDWQVRLNVNTGYTLATTTKSYAPNDGSIGRQIPYTPRYQVQGGLDIGFRKWYFNYSHVYAGYRFVTTDESQYLEPYHSGSAALQYADQWKGRPYRLMLQCFNITDERYAVVAFRPMPGRYWQGGISFSPLP